MGLLLLLGLIFLIFGLGGLLGLLTFAGYAAVILIVIGSLAALIGGLASCLGEVFGTIGGSSFSRRSSRQRERHEMEEGHHHECYEGHHWQHTGPTAPKCSLRLTTISSEDCPTCTGREELLIRGLHGHACLTCDAEWTHKGRCTDERALSCPWCSPRGEARFAQRGPHKHYCPQCFQKWEHVPSRPSLLPVPAKRRVSCSAPYRAVVPECPGCREVARLARGSLVQRFGRALGRAIRR